MKAAYRLDVFEDPGVAWVATLRTPGDMDGVCLGTVGANVRELFPEVFEAWLGVMQELGRRSIEAATGKTARIGPRLEVERYETN